MSQPESSCNFLSYFWRYLQCSPLALIATSFLCLWGSYFYSPYILWALPFLFSLSYCLGRSTTLIQHLITLCLLAIVLSFHILDHKQSLQATFQTGCHEFRGYPIEITPYHALIEGIPYKGGKPLSHTPCRWLIKYAPPLSFTYGKNYQIIGYPYTATDPKNPGEFNTPKWLHGQNIIALCKAQAIIPLHEISCYAQFIAYSHSSQHFFSQQIDRYLAPNSAESDFIKSLVLGEKFEADPQLIDLFKTTGLLHLFAISGFHIGIVTGFITLTLLPLRFRPSTRIPLLLFFVLLYVFITGFSVSALRAAIMIIAFFIGFAFTNPSTTLNRLSLAFLLILCFNPFQLEQLGFQLSFSLFAIVVVCSRSAQVFAHYFAPDDYIPPVLYSRIERLWTSIIRKGACLLLISLGAWLGSLCLLTPITGYITPYTPVLNILLGLPITLLMGTSLLYLSVSYLPLIGPFLAKLSYHLAHIVLYITQASLQLPHPCIPFNPPAPATQLTLYALPISGYSLGQRQFLLGLGTDYEMHNILLPAFIFDGYTPRFILDFNLPLSENIGSIPQKHTRTTTITSTPKSKNHHFPNGLRKLQKKIATSPILIPQGATYSLPDHYQLTRLILPAPPNLTRKHPQPIYLLKRNNCSLLFLGESTLYEEQQLLKFYPHLRIDILVLKTSTHTSAGTPELIQHLSPRLIVYTHKTKSLFEKKLPLSLKSATPPQWDLEQQGALHLDTSIPHFGLSPSHLKATTPRPPFLLQ